MGAGGTSPSTGGSGVVPRAILYARIIPFRATHFVTPANDRPVVPVVVANEGAA